MDSYKKTTQKNDKKNEIEITNIEIVAHDGASLLLAHVFYIKISCYTFNSRY